MCRFGDIYISDRNIAGNLHKLKQTVLVVSDDRTNKSSPFVTVVPITDAVQRDNLSGYVFIGSYGMSEENIAVVEQITTLDKSHLLIKVGGIRGTVYAEQIKQAIKSYLGL